MNQINPNYKISYYTLNAAQKKLSQPIKILSSNKITDSFEGENFNSFEETAANVNQKLSRNDYKSSTVYMNNKQNIKENIYRPKGGIKFNGMPKGFQEKKNLLDSGNKALPLYCCSKAQKSNVKLSVQ